MIDFTDAFTNNTFQVAVYVTSPAAQVWLREVPMDIQAYQVYKSNNSVWPNKVYVCKIADFLRDEVLSNFPEADDVHTDPAMILETYIREYEMGVRSLSNVNAKDVRPIIVSGEDQFKI
ncbi:hypothetical protein FGIG_05839 [Fasciola gigantica]|uniref:Uncharacterized protein n=1 Tax=Fasciola gigantica TaxID=46835 RepID=A0A504YHG9_FASGI|nr:hypothetical protein FGIG_05839 [Fasciola gigantica]